MPLPGLVNEVSGSCHLMLTPNWKADDEILVYVSVIAIDTSMERLKIARHNAMQYGVADRIEFICADYVEFVGSWARRKQRQREERGEMEVVVGLGEEVDVIFLSPPWGESRGCLYAKVWDHS